MGLSIFRKVLFASMLLAAASQEACSSQEAGSEISDNLQLVQMSATKTKLTTRTDSEDDPDALGDAFEDPDMTEIKTFPDGCAPKCYDQNKTLGSKLVEYVARSGGKAYFQFVGDSTVESIHKKFIAASNEGRITGLTLEYVQGQGILDASQSWFKADATVTLFNIGLHCQHLHPYRSCSIDKPSLMYQNCGKYDATVDKVADLIHAKAPGSRMVWKTTSQVCPEKFGANAREGVQAWATDKSTLIAQCQKDCPQFAEGSGRRCEDELYNEDGVRNQHQKSMEVLSKISYPVSVLDAFQSTADHCDESKDGKHYPSFDWVIAIQFINML